MSECTDGFPTLFHIDKLAKTKLETRHERQVVIPGINFACSGSITSVVIGAKWENDEAYTELQIWRSNSAGVYVKINGANIIADRENTSRVYEITLDPPLAFQDGDILGYFQPDKDRSQLDLYLEKSGRIMTYYTDVDSSVVDPPATGALFNIINDHDTKEDTRYPLIAARTGAYIYYVLCMQYCGDLVALYSFSRSSRLWVWLHVNREGVCTTEHTTTTDWIKERL